MPEPEQQQITDDQLVDDSQLEEQVGLAESEFEDAVDEDDQVGYDESDESVDPSDDDLEDETIPPVEDPRIEQMSGQVGQLTELVKNLMGQLNSQKAASEQALEDITVSEEVESFTQQDAVKHSIQQAQQQTQKQIQQAMQQVNKPMSMHAAVINVLLTGHSKEGVVRQAIDLAGNGMPFVQAMKTAEGLVAGQANKKLVKENNQFKRTTKKRSRKASRGRSRPSGKSQAVVRDNSHEAAARRIAKEMGMKFGD